MKPTIEAVARLADEWDERVLHEVSRFDRVVPEIEQRGSVLRDPATEGQIAAAEERLEVRLPPSYRAFLLVSNGAHASSIGAEKAYDGVPRRHGLLPVEDVVPVAEADRFGVELWTGADELNDPRRDQPPTGRDPVDVRYYEPLRRGLLVSRPFEVWRDVLVPRDGVVEWELWAMAKEGAGAYRSFADFLRFQVDRPDWMPRRERAEEYVEGVRGGNLRMLDFLAEIADPRAGELAVEWLESDELANEWDRMLPATVLGKLADPAHIAALGRAYERATIGSYRITLLAALDASGAPDARKLIHAAADDLDPQIRRWATRKLSAGDRDSE